MIERDTFQVKLTLSQHPDSDDITWPDHSCSKEIVMTRTYYDDVSWPELMQSIQHTVEGWYGYEFDDYGCRFQDELDEEWD